MVSITGFGADEEKSSVGGDGAGVRESFVSETFRFFRKFVELNLVSRIFLVALIFFLYLCSFCS